MWTTCQSDYSAATHNESLELTTASYQLQVQCPLTEPQMPRENTSQYLAAL